MSIPPNHEYGGGPAGRFSSGGPIATEPLPPQHHLPPQQGYDRRSDERRGHQGPNPAERAAEVFQRVGWSPETKPFFLTSEFWVMLVAVFAVLIAADAELAFPVGHAWTLVTVLAVGYMVTRGLSRAGTRYGESRQDRGNFR